MYKWFFTSIETDKANINTVCSAENVDECDGTWGGWEGGDHTHLRVSPEELVERPEGRDLHHQSDGTGSTDAWAQGRMDLSLSPLCCCLFVCLFVY